jgi:hypothetical protein
MKLDNQNQNQIQIQIQKYFPLIRLIKIILDRIIRKMFNRTLIIRKLTQILVFWRKYKYSLVLVELSK